MKEVNDFEVSSVKEVPLIVGTAVNAKRCIKCNKVIFANYPKELNDYECMKCRPMELLEISNNIKTTSVLTS